MERSFRKKAPGWFLIFLFIGILSLRSPAQKVGLVLSGGGASAIAHVGVMKALEEEGIPIDYITGTSMGAFIGGCYAAGMTPEEIDSLVTSPEFQTMAEGNIPEKYRFYFNEAGKDASLIRLKLFKDSLLQRSIPTNLISPVLLNLKLMEIFSGPSAAADYDFDELFVPFRCVAADVEQKREVILDEGNLNQAIRASMSYPFYLHPIEVNGSLLFDGGLYNNYSSDLMYETFLPDVIIGSNVSENIPTPRKGNIISQVKNMLTDRTEYSEMCRDFEVQIEPDPDRGTFDFDGLKKTINAGYEAAMEKMDTILKMIDKRVPEKTLERRRETFRTQIPEMKIDRVDINGLSGSGAQYVKKTMGSERTSMSLDDVKRRYYRLISDNKIESVFPRTRFDQRTGKYDLILDIEKGKDIFASFGGNFSSRPINTGYIGLQYNYLGRTGITLDANSYFGKFYTSIGLSSRFDFPGRTPFFLEPVLTLNRWDYFKSSTAFFADIKPPFLVQTERYGGLKTGIPAGNHGQLTLDGKVGEITNEYFQGKQFTSGDTADKTEFRHLTAGIGYERNTLNRKQYANKGTKLELQARMVEGQESTIPGSTAIITDTVEKGHEWFQARLKYQNYFKARGTIHLGVRAEAFYSTQPFFDNYTGTILSAPAFQPIPESKTLFLEEFRAHKYTAFGLQSVLAFTKDLDLRLEGYAFQPFQPIREDRELKAFYGPVFPNEKYYIGSGTAVYDSPLGPISLSLNYFKGKEEPFSLLFNFGYILHNDKSLE